MSVTSSQRSAEEEEEGFEESVSNDISVDPVISFFSRQAPKKSFPLYPPNADPYDEDLAEQAFLKSKPASFLVLGKPGAGKTTLAKNLAKEWKCQFINAFEVITETIKKKDDHGQLIKSILANGEAVSDELVLQMIAEKIKSAEVAHQGYVLDDLPTLNEDFMTVQQQLETMKNWGMTPDFLINIKIADSDLLNRRLQQKVDPVTGEVFTKDVYDPEEPKKKEAKSTDENEDAEEEAVEEEAEEEAEEDAAHVNKLSQEVLDRLLWRPEDQLVNVSDSIRKYNSSVLQKVENLMAEHNQQYLIELDGNRSAQLLLEDVLEILQCFPIQPAVHPIHLADPVEVEEGEEEEEAVPEPVEDMETEELMRSLSSKFAPTARHRWRRSRWLRSCPVELADGKIVPGKVEFTVAFLDKLYVLSSAAAMEKFMKNPRPFLMPPQPRPPCKIVVQGPAKAGKTQLCYRLADKYGAQVINVEQVIQPKIVAERNRRMAEFEEEATQKAIEEVTARLRADNPSEQRLEGEAVLKAGRDSAAEEEEEEEGEEDEDKEGNVSIKVTADDEQAEDDDAEQDADVKEEDGAGSARSKEERVGSSHSSKRISQSALSLPKDAEGEQQADKSSSRGSETAAGYPPSDSMKSDESLAEMPSATSIQTAADQPSKNELATVPVYVDASTPEVISIVQDAMRAMDFYDFQLPDEVWLDTLEDAIADAEKSRLDRDPSKPLHGGWIVDGFPRTKEQWALLFERNKSVPDHVIYLQDESPNGDFLIQRWYATNKFNVNDQIELRKQQEELTATVEDKISGSTDSKTAQVKPNNIIEENEQVEKHDGDAAQEDGAGDTELLTREPVLPEEGPELNAQREARKLHDAEWAESVNVLAGAGTEALVINVSTVSADDAENGVFLARSRNEIFDETLGNITKSFTYQAWERTGVDIDEEEAFEEEEEAVEEEEEPTEEEEEQEEIDPNRSLDKQLGDTTFYCPVALVEKGVLWPGDPECSAKYREKIYYFASEEAREKFLANPAAFLPKERAFEPPAIRLWVIGPHGAGKTLHGRELARKLGLYHIQFRERLQELVIAKTKKRVRPEREEEQELEEQDLSPEEVEEDDESDSDDSETETELEESKESVFDKDHPVGETASDVLLSALKNKDDEQQEEEEEEMESPEEVPLTEDEEAIVAYLKDDEPLPPELLQKLINDWWHQEPFKSNGFIIEDLPHSADEAASIAELGLYPDAAIVLEVEDSDVIARLLPPRLARWRNRRKQKLERRQQHKDKKQKKREAKMSKRRSRLVKEAAKRKAERLAAREAAKEDGDEDEEEEPEEEEEDIEAILADEFPVEEEEPEEEEETEEEAIERMKSEISETCENDLSLLAGVTEKLEELMIPCIQVTSGRKPHIVRYLLNKKLHSIVQCRYSMFERVYPIKPRIAKKLLSSGYKQLSRFGRWCPVKLLDGGWMPADYSSGVPYFPAIYRQHIYFLSSADARNQFALNPVAYLCQPSPKPVVPIRIAIIGPPKSGKSTLARRFAQELGVVRLSIGEAIRWVLSNQPNSELSKCIQSYLFNGHTVPDECAVQALEVVLMSKTCRTRGYVLDGYPVKKIQVDYMEQRNIIPVQVIELEISGTDCADRATADRYSKDRVLPLHDSAPIYYVKWSEWQREAAEVRQWYRNEHDNWVGVPGGKSKWWVWNAVVEITQKAVVRIQTYLQRTNDGLAASIAGMCITQKEFERRQSEFNEYCPVNLADKNQLVDCSLYKHFTYAAEYKGLYYKMEGPEQLEKFLAEPDKYVAPKAPRHLPLPKLLPRRRTKAETKQMFPMAIELRGYCPVTFVDGKCRYEAIVPGDPELVAEYDGKLYCFANEDNLQKFMRSPHLYHNLTLPHKLPPKRDPLVVGSLPMLGYMEQTVALAITKALTAVGTVKPKYPFVSATRSALIYAAYHLKAYNPKNPEYIRKKYKKKLDQFEEKCELIRYLGNHMTSHYRDPKDRPIDFDFKMDKFVQLQSQDQVTSWVA